MGESLKGVAVAAVETKKPSASMDDDGFGKDFLTSWKMVVADEKDGLDFAGVTPQKERKKLFDFGKLDDFEFGDFGKMPSFKMEMSDIDFSSPEGTAEKPDQSSKGGSISGKTDKKKDNFSFNFDFNELEGFGIESNLLKAEKDSQIKNKGQGCSNKNEVNYDIRKNSDMRDSDKTDIGFKKLKESTELAKSDDRVVDAPLSLDKEIVSTKGIQTKGNEDVEHKRPLQLTGLKSLAINEKIEDKVPKKQLELASFKTLNSKSASEAISLQNGDKSSLDDSLGKSVKSDSPLLKGSRSFLQSLDLECSPRTCIQEAESKVSDAPKVHLEGLNDRAREITPEQLDQEKMVVKDAQLLGTPSTSCISPNLQYERNNDADRRASHPSVLVSTKTSALEKEEPRSVKGCSLQLSARASALHLKPSIKQEGTKSILSSSTTSKELRTFSGLKRERFNEKRESSNGTNETLQSGIALKLSDGKAKKQGLLCLQSDAEKDCNALVQSQPFTKPQEGSSSGVVEPANPQFNAFSNIKLIKISSFEKHESSGNVDKRCHEEKTMSSGVNSSNSRSVITKKMEPYATRSSNMRLEIPRASTFTSNLNGKKLPSWNSPLKRKSLEVSNTEMPVLSPLKRLAGSPVQRKAFEETPIHVEKQNDDQLVLITSTEGECSKDLSLEKRSPSKDAPIAEQSLDVELASPVDDDEYRKKAESYSKELDDLCSTLKKKHEEAKELLVHAVVNNNSLLMLNHPLYDEKIRSFARIVNSLLDRKYEIW